MRFRPLRILVLLILGALINAAVSVKLYLNSKFPAPWLDDPSLSECAGIWNRHLGSSAHHPYALYSGIADGGLGYGKLMIYAMEDKNSPYTEVFEFQSGWPAWSFAGQKSTTLDIMPTLFNLEIMCFTAIGDETSDAKKRIPCLPLFPGFLINMVFYALLLRLLFIGPLLMQRFVRGYRGHCPHCNNDLHAAPHTHCSECGALISSPITKSS